MTPEAAHRLIVSTTEGWVADESSAAVWAGEHDGRRGVRLAQTSRDFTTLWFEIGELTVATEAYLLPPPHTNHAEVYRQALMRNDRSWPAYVAMDVTGGLYVRTRTPLVCFDAVRLEEAVGASYELVEVAFRALVTAAFGQREKSP